MNPAGVIRHMTRSVRRLALLFMMVAMGAMLASCGTSGRKGAPITLPGANKGGDIPIPRESGPVIAANAERLYPNEELFVCPGMTVSNAPETVAANRVKRYSRLVVVNGVPIVTAPANNACVSSGFGERWGRQHKGLDITSRPASRVFAGGSGTVLEAGMNGGFGLAVLIDHGNGVYTRYAHLRHLDDRIRAGAEVWYGKPLGLMGASGHVTGIHLHYEILTGTYVAGVWGRGLTARDPFSFPAWVDERLERLAGGAIG